MTSGWGRIGSAIGTAPEAEGELMRSSSRQRSAGLVR
jgi:hypothetical protein